MRAIDDCQPGLDSYLNVKKDQVVEYAGIGDSGLPFGILNNQIGYIQMEAYKVSSKINIKKLTYIL